VYDRLSVHASAYAPREELQLLLAFAESKGMSELSIWAIERDHSTDPGISRDPYVFSPRCRGYAGSQGEVCLREPSHASASRRASSCSSRPCRTAGVTDVAVCVWDNPTRLTAATCRGIPPGSLRCGEGHLEADYRSQGLAGSTTFERMDAMTRSLPLAPRDVDPSHEAPGHV